MFSSCSYLTGPDGVFPDTQYDFLDDELSTGVITTVDLDLEMEEEYTEENSHDLRGFNKKFKPRFKNFKMVAGHIHTFNVKLNHTMINDGNADRVTLSIDMKKNQWVEKFLDTFVKK